MNISNRPGLSLLNPKIKSDEVCADFFTTESYLSYTSACDLRSKLPDDIPVAPLPPDFNTTNFNSLFLYASGSARSVLSSAAMVKL